MKPLKRSIALLAVVFLIVCLKGPVSLWSQETPPLGGAPSAPELRTISMDFDGASLKEVLRVLSQLSGLNFVASEEVEAKKITVYFESVPVLDALESIVRANNLRYDQKPGSKIFVVRPTDSAVAPVQLETKIFRLKYARLSISPLDIGGQGVVSELSAPEELGESSEDSGEETESESTTEAGAAGATTNLVAERGIDKIVSSLLSPSGKVTADIFTNSLIVTDIPETIAKVEQILQEIDTPPPQVVIEVYLMEVKKNILRDHGIEWGGGAGAMGAFTGGSLTTGFPFKENFVTRVIGKTSLTETQTSSALTLGTLNAANFKATLHFLTSDTRTRILAKPRVLTLNNEAAIIKLVTNTAIAKITTSTASEGVTTTATNTAERTEVGIVLKMTPQINADESIGLFVEPSVTTVAASSFFPSDFLDPTTRIVRTMARVQNHHTLVIGGLLDRNNDMTAKKIPLLGDLPLAGFFFRYNDGSDVDTELVVFITPHIVEGYDSLASESATAISGKDLVIRRVAEAFLNEEFERVSRPLEALTQQQATLDRQENSALRRQAKESLSRPVNQKMNETLDLLELLPNSS